MIEKGTILQNRYRIEKQIGQGGMGKVYVASDERFNSTVAIKETVFEDLNLRKAFEREARLLNSLKHSALPRVSDHFNEGNGQFLVMEYIAGEDLAEMIERKGEPFSLEEVLKWAYQLCDALEYLHSQSIIHRDIKPQNLKLTPSGQIILLDFGLAKGNPTDAQNQTAAKSIFGYSLNYASLEQIQGTGTEPQSDLYSLAATIYHLLTGVPPSDALTRAMKVLNRQPDPLIPANRKNKNVPHGVAQILQKTMALDAAERPVSAVSMKRMLENSDKISDSDELFAGDDNLKSETLNQETKLFSAVTNVLQFNQTDAETKISPERIITGDSLKTNIFATREESKKTNVQAEIQKTHAPNRSRAAVVLSGFLLTVAGASVVYYNSDHARFDSKSAPVQAETKSSVVITPPAETEFAKPNAITENTELASEIEAKKPVKETASKIAETGKRTVKETKNPPKKTSAGKREKNIDGDEDKIVITEKGIEMKDMFIEENGFRMKYSVPKPHIPPIDFKVLNSEQIRKLKELENKKKRFVYVNPPKSAPTP